MDPITTVTTQVEVKPKTDENDDDDSGVALSVRFLSTKFLLALLFSISGCVGLFLGKIDANSFIWLTGVVLTGHGASNILDKRFNPGSQP